MTAAPSSWNLAPGQSRSVPFLIIHCLAASTRFHSARRAGSASSASPGQTQTKRWRCTTGKLRTQADWFADPARVGPLNLPPRHLLPRRQV